MPDRRRHLPRDRQAGAVDARAGAAARSGHPLPHRRLQRQRARDAPELVGQIFSRVLKEIESGVLPWLPCTTFPFEKAADAFRYMAQARHIGRVVFRHRVEPRRLEQPVVPDATYLITGGLKGLGLLAAQWLAGEGARHLLLVGRSAPDEAAARALDDLRSEGVQVEVLAADIGTAQGVQRVMDALDGGNPRLGGVIHCAAVLDDGVLARQSLERFSRVMAPKADGAWRLHAAFGRHGHRPDFFVLYSSLSAILGSPGQGNYVAANAFLDALAHHRREQGLAATAIDWGAWAEVGMATRGNTVARAGAQGLAALSPTEGMQALGVVLREQLAQVAVAPIDWAQLGAQFGAAPIPPLLRDLVAQSRNRSGAATRAGHGGRGPRVDYAELDTAQRRQQITAMVRQELATVLALSGSADSIPSDVAFSSLGLDSLTAVELRNRLQGAIGRPVPPTAAFDWPTIDEMSQQLASLFDAAAEPVVEGQAPSSEGRREEMTL
ncbi:SDR family NAD(P)-dependent oxidoreductase [Piscinibacter aquaticus]|uniref:SDR family NAD(P)-dependent oxidoreductase n=1 Tax=Piscinibacter aquaticus TaxID=392597 RepID=A0A5C6U2Z3_9BURK|nr:SDR family NAD(P)-dependent oxidoreductase [Piscinibacter aquaticus]